MRGIIGYKLMDKETGRFSNGSATPSFTANGKMWATLAYLKSHITMIKQYPGTYPYKNCVIVSIVGDYILDEGLTADMGIRDGYSNMPIRLTQEATTREDGDMAATLPVGVA